MTIVVGTSNGLFVDGDLVALEGVEITALTYDGTDLFAGTDEGRVLRGGLTGIWNEIGSTDGDRINCLLCNKGILWAGTTRSRLLYDDGNGLDTVAGFEEVEGRSHWFTPWGGPPDVRSLAADGGDSIFVNVHVGGIPTSYDGGRSWTPTIDIETDVHQVVYSDERVLAATAYGLSFSDDGGKTWSSATEGLHANYSRALAVTNDHVLLSASTGPGGSRSALYRKPLGSGSFERCTNGFPEVLDDNIDTHTLAAEGVMAAVGAPDGHLYVSEDEGASWTHRAGGLPSISAVVLISGS